MNTQFDVIIVANGEFPTHEIPLDILKNAKHIVACDGAIKNVPQAEVVVGDGDSVPAAFHDRLIQIEEQEDNDLTKTTRYCLSMEWHKIRNPKRHFRFSQNHRMRLHLIHSTNWIRLRSARRDKKGQQVSIFNFGCKQLTSEGLKWNSYAYDEWWQGTLNEALGNKFSFHADSYYLVYQTYDVSRGRQEI